MRFSYYYAWGNNPVRAAWKGRHVRLLARGALGTVLIEDQRGQRLVTSGRALRHRARRKRERRR